MSKNENNQKQTTQIGVAGSSNTNDANPADTDEVLALEPNAEGGESVKANGAFNALKTKSKQIFSTRSMALTGIFAAMSWVLYMFVKFPLPMIFPGFLDFQISDLPALICGFCLGPVQAVLVLLIKIALKLPFSGTMFVGELADVIVGLAFILPPSIIYRFKRTFNGAIIGISVGIVFSTLAAVVANYYILVPFFVRVTCEGDWNRLLSSVRVIYPDVTKETFYKSYLLLAVIPFNLIRGLLSGGITLLVYKRLSKALKGLFKAR